ncbi:MAG TPA: hypothetical protein VFP84_05645 [Kofleriaceae bacterium]|nr:hypothetical protein [Kofleriaceae bacterium]
MSRAWWIATLGLTAFLAAIALTLSRLGLIVHELIGHGGAALAVGGRVTDVHLFWFAGGWIRYDVPDVGLAGALAISLGGIAIESVIGVALWIGLARGGGGLGRRTVRTLGAALFVHAMWYLATGTWHGYGDGRLIHAAAGDARYPIAIAAGLVGGAAGFAGARLLFASIRSVTGLAGALLAIAAAATINVALDLGELHLRRDAPYATIMQPERERAAARELAAWQAAQPAADAAAIEAQKRALAAAHRDVPFAWLLGASLIVAIVAGAARSPTCSEHALARRTIGLAAAAAVISTATVIAIDAGFH